MRILVVEDDDGIREVLAQSLRSEAFAVDTAKDGERGSFLARTNEYDLVILDYLLPKKDGPAVCSEIRESGKDMPILALSVRSDIEDKVGFLSIGADDYLTKPFSYKELLARIRALLRRPRKQESEVINCGLISIDSTKQEVLCAKKSVNLTRKEYALLEYLARNQGEVLSRSSIMEHVWDIESNPFSNTIEAHIFNLRKKLGENSGALIATVPGRGYRLEIPKI